MITSRKKVSLKKVRITQFKNNPLMKFESIKLMAYLLTPLNSPKKKLKLSKNLKEKPNLSLRLKVTDSATPLTTTSKMTMQRLQRISITIHFPPTIMVLLHLAKTVKRKNYLMVLAEMSRSCLTIPRQIIQNLRIAIKTRDKKSNMAKGIQKLRN